MQAALKLASVVLALVVPAVGAAAQQAQYPTRPITWVLAAGAGGETDNSARFVARVLSEKIGHVPTFKERGVNIELTAWASIAMPAGTPPEIVNKMSAAMAETMSDPTVVKYFEENDFGNLGHLGPEKLKDFYVSESEKFKKVVEKAGVSLD